MLLLIPSFRGTTQCSPFCAGIFINFNKENPPCLLFYVDMRILIDKELKHFYMLQERLIFCNHGHIL